MGRCNSGSGLSGGPHFNVNCHDYVGVRVRLYKYSSTWTTIIHSIAIMSSQSTIPTPCTASLTSAFTPYGYYTNDSTEVSQVTIVESLSSYWTAKGYTTYYVYDIEDTAVDFTIRWSNVGNGDCSFTEEVKWNQDDSNDAEALSNASSYFTESAPVFTRVQDSIYTYTLTSAGETTIHIDDASQDGFFELLHSISHGGETSDSANGVLVRLTDDVCDPSMSVSVSPASSYTYIIG